MADTFYVQTELAPIFAIERLAPNPTCADEYNILRTLGGATQTTLQQGLFGTPANSPYVVAPACWALFNGPGSGKKVNVHTITITETQARTATATTNRLNTQRVTAIEGGDDITPVGLDSTNGAIPAQVLLRENVGAITVTGGVLRTVLDLPQLNPTRAVCYPTWRLPGGMDRVLGVGGVDAVQGQVLREGQGLAIQATGGVAKENVPLAVVAVIDIAGATYWVRSRLQTSSFAAQMAILNGSGSGVVVEVLGVYVAEVATDEIAFNRRFGLETISGLTPNSRGDNIDVVSMDSTNAALPSQIAVVEKAGCLQIGGDGARDNATHPRFNENVLRRLVTAPLGVGPGLACAVPVGQRLQRQFVLGEDYAFVLRPGEGVGLFLRQLGSGYGWGYQLQCRFSVEDLVETIIAPVLGSTIVRAS